jgi:N-acetylmuramoyl-L-alanine amidase
MILQTVYPGQNFSAQNSFFYSPIKRRIMMLTKNKNPKVSYYSRLLVLPLTAIVFFAFTLKLKNKKPLNLYDGKLITVVVDAGHGGLDNGAVSADGVKEKDITLSIAKKIADLNSNRDIKILLSRNDNQLISVKDRVLFSKENDADLFISLHVNGSDDKQLNGFSVLIDKENSAKNMLLGSALINELKKSYQTAEKIGVREKGVWVLDHNVCPAALIECGFLSNSNDKAFITNKDNQEKVAKNILNAINVYASSKKNDVSKSEVFTDNSSVLKDTIPSMQYNGKEIKNISVQSKSKNIKVTEPVIKVTYEDGSTEMISKKESERRGLVLPPPPPPGLPPAYFKSNALFVINDKISTSKKTKELDPESIESINILKDKEATDKYGDKGKNGVVEIVTKFDIPENVLIIIDGKESSKQELNNIPGSEIKSINILKKEPAIEKYGDKAKDGSIEIFTRKNIIISSKDTLPDKVFTKVEVEASFPGGLRSWTKYISRAISDSISKFTDADYGTCVIRFIVNVDGKVSDVIATTMKGTELAKVSVNAIKNGPKWIPASQNGKPVAAYRLQPVTLQNPDSKPPSTDTKSNKKSTVANLAKDPDMVLVKLEQTATFPGGQPAWLKYISRAIQKDANKLTADKNSEGTCKVRFIVSKDGNVSDVKAVTKEGSQLADVAVNAIKNGPRWIPGRQNGHTVNSYMIQPVNFAINDNSTIKNEPE